MNRQIIDEAAEWFVEVSEGEVDVATRQRFHAWLTLSPEHVRAFLKILPMWHDGVKLDAGGDPNALIAQARATTNIVPLAGPAHQPHFLGADAKPQKAKPRPLYKYAFAATVVLIATTAFTILLIDKAMYATSIGEQRTVVLEDGSNVELNSRSRIKIRFNDHERSIELLEGQALFKVAKDAARPFVVRSGDAYVRAVGTQFDVYRKRSGTTITVVEGKVAVASPTVPETGDSGLSRPASPGGPAGDKSESPVSGTVVLTAGQQLTITPTTQSKPKPANVSVATAWTRKQLVFFSTPLPEVAEEFNRYNERQLVLNSENLQTFNVTGAFSSTDPAALIRFLQVQVGLKVEESRHAVTVSVRETN